MHRSALNGSGANERHFDHEVVEATRLEARQRGHLRARFDLEHTHGVGAAQHGVHVVVLRQGSQIDVLTFVLGYQVDRAVQRRQHAQAQQIELHETGRRAVVLVPLQHAAIAHGCPLDRAHLDHGSIADDHATRVDAEMSRHVFDLHGQLEHRWRDGVIGTSVGAGLFDHTLHTAPAIDLFRPRVLLAG